MSLRKALERYEQRREEAEKRTKKLRREYGQWLSEKKKELLMRISALEKRRPPKNVDERLLQRVEVARKSYVSALRRAVEDITTMEDLGKRLPDMAKLHIDYGRHVMILYERDVYAINAVLKGLNEGYSRYLEELSAVILPKLKIEELLAEIEKVSSELTKLDEEIARLRGELTEKRKALEAGMSSGETEEILVAMDKIRTEIRKVEIEIRSMVSKLAKPLKRMRLGGFADEVVKDSGIVIERPEEFLELLQTVYPRLEGKAKKAADWLLKNLGEELKRLEMLRGKLSELKFEEERRRDKLKPLLREIEEIEKEIKKREILRAKLERKRGHLEGELRAEMEGLEKVLGVEIER